MDMLLGLDVGTTATKALLMSVEGEVIASASYSYGLITPREDWVEQDPEELWRGVVAVCREVIKHVESQDRVLALSISAQGGTTIPVDAHFQPVGNAISWMDNRAHEQSQQIRENTGEDRIYQVTGWQLGDGLPLLHISWLRQSDPENFALTRYFLFVNDFIVYRLTGELCMDPSDAGITQLYNIAEGRWDRDMLETAGIRQDQLSPVQNSGVAVGKIIAEASQETGLPSSVLVVNGAHDQYCAALGTGVLKPGDVMLSCGTAWVILGTLDQLRLDPEKRLSISPHVIPDRWGALKSLGGVGACMEWFLHNLWSGAARGSELYKELNRGVNSVPAGSRGLIFFPSSGGYGRGARGAFMGLTLSHSREDMARAVMEGIVFELRWTMENVREAGLESRGLRMVGGAAASPVWPRIVADITHLPVAIPSTTEAASCGAAILAGVGGGVFTDPEEGYASVSGQETRLEPDQRNVRRYDDMFDVYRNVGQQTRNLLSRLSSFDAVE